jgi:hypothetical protein
MFVFLLFLIISLICLTFGIFIYLGINSLQFQNNNCIHIYKYIYIHIIVKIFILIIVSLFSSISIIIFTSKLINLMTIFSWKLLDRNDNPSEPNIIDNETLL